MQMKNELLRFHNGGSFRSDHAQRKNKNYHALFPSQFINPVTVEILDLLSHEK